MKKGKKGEEKKKRRKIREWKKKRGNKGKGLQFSVFRRSKFVCPRIKVGLLNESYE